MTIGQLWIMLFGCTAVILSQHPSYYVRRWACICGLIGQPAWFYETFTASQWGMFVAAFFYTYGWLLGVKTYWLTSYSPSLSSELSRDP